MSSMNRVTIIGNLGKDPEIRTFQNGGKVANLSVATSESWTDKTTGEVKEKTEWHKVAVFGDGLVSVVERFVKRGSKVFLEGSIETRSYDKEGETRYSTEIVLRGPKANLILLGGKRDEETRENVVAGPGAGKATGTDDAIPF